MDYKETPQSGNSYTHQWDIASEEKYDGGFRLVKTNLPTDLEKLPRGTFVKLDLTERKATVVKTAKIAEAVTALTTTVKVEKGSLLVVGDIVGIGTTSVEIEDFDTSNEDYDSFTITAEALGTIALGGKLQEYAEAGDNKAVVNPDGFTPAEVVIDREPSCSAIFKAYGIVASQMPYPVTDAIISALGKCQFV